MTMQKVRLKALRNNPYSTLSTNKRICKHKDRVTTAINQNWILKEVPEKVRELMIEQACLRAEIVTITIKEGTNKKSNASVLIAEKLKRIDLITKQIHSRKCIT
ncbi:hypothetical protein D8682_00950 (plasmid) [Buttiauxella sp. 3AFRM03]|uniref:hypothetical protein n=1 Tax=Buttiauxella sp. 3AFRM03 TaxID=2479367 RepID=UPI000EF7C7B4|nr:hypothetical protein [Buttiauxella sp. 3AFRM03]AYN25682.1 hypothetical protein D8682_00950 [Buttiauxella sp. 3AFRM03]